MTSEGSPPPDSTPDPAESIIPLVEKTYPVSEMWLPPELLEAMAKADPTDLVDLVRIRLKLLQDQQQGELELEKVKIEIQKESLKLKAQSASEDRNLIRLVLGVFCFIFIAVLIYSGATGDTELPSQLLTLVSGLLAGGGAVATLQQRRKDQEIPKSDEE